MNLLHLEYFYSVARLGGFSRASEHFRISQPAISRMVSQLEINLGIKLFEKIGRNVRLTREGQDVFKRCELIFKEVEDLKSSLGEITGELKGPLALGAAEAIASHYLPKPLHHLHHTYPAIHPTLLSAPSTVVFEKMIKGDLELGFFFHTQELPDNLEMVLSLPIRFHLVVSKEKRRDEKTLSSFIGSREVEDNRSKDFPVFNRYKRDHSKAAIRLSSNSLSAHQKLVQLGAGVALLPEFMIQPLLKGRVVSDLYPDEKFLFDLRVIKRRNATLSRNALELLELLK